MKWIRKEERRERGRVVTREFFFLFLPSLSLTKSLFLRITIFDFTLGTSILQIPVLQFQSRLSPNKPAGLFNPATVHLYDFLANTITIPQPVTFIIFSQTDLSALFLFLTRTLTKTQSKSSLLKKD